jgi:hypothetical protein
VFVVSAVPLFGYGVLNVAAPRLTIRWQISSTARRSAEDPRRAVGNALQQWFGIDRGAPPTSSATRRVRLLGLAEMTLGLAGVAFALLLR